MRRTFVSGRGILLGPPWRAWVATVLALAAATASLLAPWALAFDPQAWLVWGRELPSGGLTTANGPSWKPLPVLVTTPLALAGDAAPALWMVVARSGAVLALAGAWRLGRILGGTAAAAGAVAVTAIGPWWAYNAALGNSEGWLAAAVLWALVAHLQGRTRTALLLLTVAGLLRPEVWPFLLAYGAWAWRRGAGPVAVACGALLATGWLGPDVLWDHGAIGAERAARAAASPASATHADVPVLQVLADAATGVGIAACAAAAFATWRAPAARPMAALAAAYVALVGLATLAGYAGNPRYLVPALALLAVLAGVGAARAPRPAAAVVVLAALTLWAHGGQLDTMARDVAERADARRGLDAALAAFGGEARVRACGPVRTAFLTRALVALRADVPLPPITRPYAGPGTSLLPPPPSPLQRQAPVPRRGPAGQTLAVRAGGWSLWSSCEARSREGRART